MLMTAVQQSLLDPGPRLPVRASDPPTSLLAAKRLNLRARKRQVMAAAGECWFSSFTADDLLELLQGADRRWERGWVASRLSQLAADGLVVRSGVGAGRFDNWVQTWRLTPAGREWLAGDS